MAEELAPGIYIFKPSYPPIVHSTRNMRGQMTRALSASHFPNMVNEISVRRIQPIENSKVPWNGRLFGGKVVVFVSITLP